MEDIFTQVKSRLSIKQVVEYYTGTQFDRNNKCHCPFHNDVNASFSILPDKNTYKCFGCGESGSVIDFAMKFKSVDKLTAAKLLNNDFNLNLECNNNEKFNVTTYIKKCIQAIGQTDYFKKRGLSEEIIRKHKLGFDAKKQQVIIPYDSSLSYYQARSIENKRFFKPPTNIAGTEPIYNGNVILANTNNEPVFIVESPICAMSIEQYGHRAIATCGGNGVSKINETLKKCKKVAMPSFIISMDNDEHGKQFEKELSDYFKSKRIKHIVASISGKEKDPNDLLQKSPEQLVKGVIRAKEQYLKTFTTYGDLKSASEIMQMQFAPTSWYVKDLFTNGLTLICGASKSGKSWMVQQICLAVASGTPFLDKPTTKNACWYMALEDDIELSKSRLSKMLQGKLPPENFMISYEIYPMDKVDRNKPTLTEYIEENIKRNPKIKLVVIDTFQKIRSSATPGESMFAHDYRDISTLKKIADELKIAIVVIHHINKMRDKDTDGDPFARISGTNGLMASADCIFLLDKKRDEERGKFSFVGRKIQQDIWEIKQNPTNMMWEKIGTVEEEAKKREHEEYEKNPIVKSIRYLLTLDAEWRGTSTQFLEACSNYLNYTPYMTNRNIGKTLCELTDKLKEYDQIMHTAPNKNGGVNGRIHWFYYMKKQ